MEVLVELLTDLVGHDLTCPLYIATETHSIPLDIYVTHLRDKVTEKRVLLDEMFYLHLRL